MSLYIPTRQQQCSPGCFISAGDLSTTNLRSVAIRGSSRHPMTAAKKAWRHATESRHARGYGTAWDKLRKAVMLRDCGLCQQCMKSGRIKAATQVDHIIPKAKDGTDEPSNLQAICTACHDDKTITDTGGTVRPTIGADGWPVTG